MNGQIVEKAKEVLELSKRLLPQNNKRYIEKVELGEGVEAFY